MPGDCLGIGQPLADLDNVADRPPSCRIRNQSHVAREGAGLALSPHAEAGVVTLLKEEHENSASRIFSNDRDCHAPHVHSRRAKVSVGPCRSEMTLDVESVVGGCVS